MIDIDQKVQSNHIIEYVSTNVRGIPLCVLRVFGSPTAKKLEYTEDLITYSIKPGCLGAFDLTEPSESVHQNFVFFRDHSALCLGSLLAKLAEKLRKEGTLLLGCLMGFCRPSSSGCLTGFPVVHSVQLAKWDLGNV